MWGEGSDAPLGVTLSPAPRWTYGVRGQYRVTHFRAGVQKNRVLIEGWIKNAFGTKYVPLAFLFFGPNGYLGELGHPRTFGISFGLRF